MAAASVQTIIERLINQGREDLADQLRSGGPMDDRLEEAATFGDPEYLQQLVGEDRNMLGGVTPLKNTAVHLALRYGHIDFALDLCKLRPALLMQQNLKDGTPLHYALKAGQYLFFVEGVGVLLTHPDLQEFWDLVHEWPMEGISVSPRGESLLYLASQVGSLEAVVVLLPTPLASNANGPKGWNALHAAVFQNHVDIARQLSVNLLRLNREGDESENTPLHHAVRLDRHSMVGMLLDTDASTAYISNVDGLSPVHVAASMSLRATFEYLVDRCPDCGLMTTKRGSNALHLSVKAGSKKIVDYILKNHGLKELLNERDEDGNTPLHLAAIKRNSRMVDTLCMDRKVNKHAKNNEGRTALDINDKYKTEKSMLKNQQNKEAEANRERVAMTLKNTASSLSLMATLITTVTFAAAFTMPGGYESNDPNKGMATLVNTAALKAFLISDAVSMCSSMTAAFHLIRAGWYNDPYFLAEVINTAIFMMLIAVGSMGVAFATGVYVVIATKCLWLAILIICMTTIIPFFMAVLVSQTLYKYARRHKEVDLDVEAHFPFTYVHI